MAIETITNNERHTCCICGKTFTGWGNSPWPVREEGTCCDECNMWHVIPIRLKRLKENQLI